MRLGIWWGNLLLKINNSQGPSHRARLPALSSLKIACSATAWTPFGSSLGRLLTSSQITGTSTALATRGLLLRRRAEWERRFRAGRGRKLLNCPPALFGRGLGWSLLNLWHRDCGPASSSSLYTICAWSILLDRVSPRPNLHSFSHWQWRQWFRSICSSSWGN